LLQTRPKILRLRERETKNQNTRLGRPSLIRLATHAGHERSTLPVQPGDEGEVELRVLIRRSKFTPGIAGRDEGA
jgi:hypothetical protein